jgi:predicted dehydrogenase
VGVVGAGTMGSLHARIVSETPGADLTCVIDPDGNAGRRLAAAHGSRWFPDFDRTDLLDALIVASSTETHRDWVEKALWAGKPVLVEKPMSTDLGDVQAMVDQSAAAGVPLMCGLVERFNPAARLAFKLVRAPLSFQATRHSPYASRVRSGVTHDLIIHDADLAVQVFGEPPTTVSAELGHFHLESAVDAEDVAEVQLTFAGGQAATLSASRIAQRKIRTIVISERDRRLEIDLIRHHVTIYRLGSPTIVDVPAIPCREPLASQLDHFLALVNGTVDAEAERRSVLPAHEILAAALEAPSSASVPTRLRR